VDIPVGNRGDGNLRIPPAAMSAAEGDIVAHLALIEPAGPTRESWLVAKPAGLTREGAGWLLGWLVVEPADPTSRGSLLA
jgi:hypothetical protein